MTVFEDGSQVDGVVVVELERRVGSGHGRVGVDTDWRLAVAAAEPKQTGPFVGTCQSSMISFF